MTGLEVVLLALNVYFGGALVFVLAIEKYPRSELAALLGWPLFLPAAGLIRLYLRVRYSCPDCPRRCSSRQEYETHLRHRNKCPGTPIPAPEDAEEESAR